MASSPAQGEISHIRGILPTQYLLDLYAVLQEYSVQFLTCDDLSFPPRAKNEEELQRHYKEEYAAWRKAARKNKDSLHVMIFHDSDSGPAQTVDLCAREAVLGIRSTNAILSHRIEDGIIREHAIDYNTLRQLQDNHGQCMTYHCNAWELCGYDETKLPQIFEDNVTYLEGKGLRIRHFSPHGGKASPDGRNNHSFFYPDITARDLVRTHNRIGINGRRYSDGAMALRLAKADTTLDLRAFLCDAITTSPRPLLLLHPQYYYHPSRELAQPFMSQNPWLAEYWQRYDQGNAATYWEPLRIVLQMHAAKYKKGILSRVTPRLFRRA